MPFVTDTFTDTNGVLLTAHSGELGATWLKALGATNSSAPIISANAARSQSLNELLQYYAIGAPASANYAATARFIYTAGLNRPVMGAGVRAATAADTIYSFYWYAGFGSPVFTLEKTVAGVKTALASVGAGLGFGTYIFTAEATASGVNGYFQRASDGFYLQPGGTTYLATKTALLASTDTSIAGAGKAAFLLGCGDDTASVVLDSFSADDPSAAPSDLAGAVTLDGVAASGVLATAPASSLAGAVQLDGAVASGTLGAAPGVMTVPELRNWSGALLTSQLIEKIAVLRLSDIALLATFTNTTSSATTADLVVSSAALVPGTAVIAVGFSGDGSQRFARLVTIA
jgi:hypothetical protein